MDRKIYSRKCPVCKKELFTTNKYWHYKSDRENKRCSSCTLKGRIFTDEWRKKLKENHANVSGKNNPFFGKSHSEETKNSLKNSNTGKNRFSEQYKIELSKKMSGSNNPFYGKSHTAETIKVLSLPKTEEHKRKLAISLKGNPSPLKGKRHTAEAKRKMRIAAIKRISKYKFEGSSMVPSINPNEGNYFNKLEKDMGWDGIFYEKSKKQFLIEELGYFVDYYDPYRNIVVEYDETNHYNPDWTLKEKDLNRQIEIIEHLKCKFYRYNEVLDKFYQASK